MPKLTDNYPDIIKIAHAKEWKGVKDYAIANPLDEAARAEEHRADVMLPGAGYGNALIIAVQAAAETEDNEAAEAAIALINAGANPNYYLHPSRVNTAAGEKKNDTTLLLAARKGNKRLVGALLKAGASILSKPETDKIVAEVGWERSPIVAAAEAEQWKTVELFANERHLSPDEEKWELDGSKLYGAKYSYALYLAIRADTEASTDAAIALFNAGASTQFFLPDKLYRADEWSIHHRTLNLIERKGNGRMLSAIKHKHDVAKLQSDIADAWGKRFIPAAGAGAGAGAYAGRFTDILTLRFQLIFELTYASRVKPLLPTQLAVLQKKLNSIERVDGYLELIIYDYRTNNHTTTDGEKIRSDAQAVAKALYTQIKDSEEEVVVASPALDDFMEFSARTARSTTLATRFSACTPEQQTEILNSWTSTDPRSAAQLFLSEIRAICQRNYFCALSHDPGLHATLFVRESLEKNIQATPEVLAVIFDTSPHRRMINELEIELSRITNPVARPLIAKYRALVEKLKSQLSDIKNNESLVEFKLKLVQLSALMTDPALQDLFALSPQLDLERDDEAFIADLPNLLKLIKAYNDRIRKLDAFRSKTFADHPITEAIRAQRAEVLTLVETSAHRSARLEVLDILVSPAILDKLTELDTKLAEALSLLPAGVRVELETEAELDTLLAKVRELHTLAVAIYTRRRELFERRAYAPPINHQLALFLYRIQSKREQYLINIKERLDRADRIAASLIESELAALKEFDEKLSKIAPTLLYSLDMTDSDALAPGFLDKLKSYNSTALELRNTLQLLSFFGDSLRHRDFYSPGHQLHAIMNRVITAYELAVDKLKTEIPEASSWTKLEGIGRRICELGHLKEELKLIVSRESRRSGSVTPSVVASALEAIASGCTKIHDDERITRGEISARAAFSAHNNVYEYLTAQLADLKLKKFIEAVGPKILADLRAEILAAREAALKKLITNTDNTETKESCAAIQAHIKALQTMDADLELILNYNYDKPVGGITPANMVGASYDIRAQYQALAEETPRVISEVPATILKLRLQSITLESTMASVTLNALNRGGVATAADNAIAEEVDALRAAKITPDTGFFGLFRRGRKDAAATPPAAGAGALAQAGAGAARSFGTKPA